jgi:3-deoxy-manno-octulosonate cytidylyltransferase (CMP-KDO synthetase)
MNLNINTELKIVGVIPAHMASLRFPGKILFPFHGYPMIEHVRRRALLAKGLDNVFVATCDQKIADTVAELGGNVIMTGDHHQNGTSRVAEAIGHIDCTHLVLLQGDEPLLLPEMVERMTQAIRLKPDKDAWNGTGPLETADELDRHSFVKCAVRKDDSIMYCFRRSPAFAQFEKQNLYIRKVLGLIAYRKEFLERLSFLSPSFVEQTESIEQMRIIENGYSLLSVPFESSLPSVNEPDEAKLVKDYLSSNNRQLELLLKIFPAN